MELKFRWSLSDDVAMINILLLTDDCNSKSTSLLLVFFRYLTNKKKYRKNLSVESIHMMCNLGVDVMQ
jgi:hypothetical protein